MLSVARKSKIRIKPYTVPPYIRKALEVLRPPEHMTVSQWAEKYRVLDNKTSARPGRWRNEVTPYLQGVMDAFNEYNLERITFCKPTQVGGTEAMNNMLGYMVSQDPGPAMVVYPTEILANSTSEERIQPMMRLSPALRDKWDEYRSTDLELHFTTMNLTLAWANSPSALASKPIRYLLMDEVDKYPGASNKEADPLSLAKERTKTYPNCKIYVTSTPTLKTGHIWKSLQSSDEIRHFFVPCPHCGEMIELKWSNVRYSDDKSLSMRDRADTAVYVCQKCGALIHDSDKPEMLRRGKWKAVERKTENVRSAGFWMNTLYSPFVKFSDAAFEFLASKDDPEKLQNFVNSWLAEPWEDTTIKTSADLVLERQTDYQQFELPDWTEILTGGVDVQQNCLYWTIRAWGKFLTSQNIAHGQAFSLDEVSRMMNLDYQKENGDRMTVRLCLIDSGFASDDIYEYCLQNMDWSMPCKGNSTAMAQSYKVSKIESNMAVYGLRRVLVDTSRYKDLIASRMRRHNGQGAWMVYNGCDREYAEQVTAEHKVNVRGRQGPQWVPKTSHADNHYLDCEVYAAAAADMCGVRTLYLQDERIEEDMKRRQAQQEQTQRESINQWLPSVGSWPGGSWI